MTTDSFYLNIQEPNRSCLLALKQIILEQDQNISESLKWSCPCFSYKNKMFCFLQVDRKTNLPYLLMVEGIHLYHPLLEKGNRKRMKSMSFNPNADLPVDALLEVLHQALDLYKNGILKIR